MTTTRSCCGPPPRPRDDMGTLAGSIPETVPLRAAAWVAGGTGVLWVFARAMRGALTRRFGRPVRRVFEAAQVPSDAADVRIVTEPGAILRGWLREPVAARESGLPGPVALVIHGWGASAADMVPLSQPLLDAGLRVLLLDARGHGRSGDVGVATMPTFAEDLRTALGWRRSPPSAVRRSSAKVGMVATPTSPLRPWPRASSRSTRRPASSRGCESGTMSAALAPHPWMTSATGPGRPR